MGGYLLYAIGEIILVVIGILIAVTINNWNNDKIDKQEEVLILEGIRNDLSQDLIDININIENRERIRLSDSLLLRNLVNKKPLNDTITGQLLFLNFGNLLLKLHNGSYQRAKSKGFDLIKDPILRDQIIRLYEFDYPYLLDIENNSKSSNINKYFENHILKGDFLDYRLSGDDFIPTLSEDNYQKFLDDKNYHVMIGLKRSVNQNFLEEKYYPTKKKITELIRKIDSVIKAEN